jgi:hypothetical protein
MDVGSFVLQSILMYALAIVIAGVVALLIRGIVVLLERRQDGRAVQPAQPAPAPARAASAAPDQAQNDVAAIAAAVYAALGVHRIVRIEPGSRTSWAAQGRWLHQTSHDVHHSHH